MHDYQWSQHFSSFVIIITGAAWPTYDIIVDLCPFPHHSIAGVRWQVPIVPQTKSILSPLYDPGAILYDTLQ